MKEYEIVYTVSQGAVFSERIRANTMTTLKNGLVVFLDTDGNMVAAAHEPLLVRRIDDDSATQGD